MTERRAASDRRPHDEALRELPLIGYSAGNFGKNLLLSGVDVTLLFMLTDLVGISPSRVTVLMAIILVGDLAFDVGAGFLATWARRSGVGYRKIIALGALPCGAAFALLYSLPAFGVRAFTLIAASLLVFRAAYAVIDVPHNSLLSGMAPDSRSRGRTSGYRLFFGTLASLGVALVLTPAVVGAAHHAETRAMAILGIACASLSCLALWIAAWSSRAVRASDGRGSRTAPIPLTPRMDRLWAAMVMIGLTTGFSAPMFGRMILYLATYAYGRSELASTLLLAMTLGQFPGFLLWTWLVRYREKTTLLILSNILTAAGIAMFASIGPRPEGLVAVAAFLGLAISGVFMLPWAILADVIDFAEYRHRDRREAATVASFLVIIKAGGAASVALVGWTLGQLGYVAGAEQGPSVLIGMKALAFGMPFAGCLVSILVLSGMAVDHKTHARILHVIKDRQSRGRTPAAPPFPPSQRGPHGRSTRR